MSGDWRGRLRGDNSANIRRIGVTIWGQVEDYCTLFHLRELWPTSTICYEDLKLTDTQVFLHVRIECHASFSNLADFEGPDRRMTGKASSAECISATIRLIRVGFVALGSGEAYCTLMYFAEFWPT
jgi:hypothetical protein